MKIKFYFLHYIVLMLFLASSLTACSGSDDLYREAHSYDSNSHMGNGNKDKKKYSFSSSYKGESVYWKVYLDDGEIVKLIKDGERIPDSELSEYKEYIYGEIEARDEEDLCYNNRVHIDSEDLDFDFDLDIDFDSEKFSESMEKLGEALSKLDIDIDVDFDDNSWEWDNDDEWDSHEFRMNMKKLKRNLKKLEGLNIKVDMDMEGFAEGMEEFAESMENFEIDLSGLDEEMEELKEELEKLKNFLEDVNEELVDDGYIYDEDEDYELELSRHSMYVNDERVPDKIHEKYLEIYVDHFGHEPKNTFRIDK